MKRITPLGALVRGLAAGSVGATAIGLFFRATADIAPSPPRFEGPDAKQKSEEPPATVARRFVEGLMKRPLPADQKEKAATVVHYAFGSGWAALWGLARETSPSFGKPIAGLGFGALVWAASDEVILPAFRLAPWPKRVPVAYQAYFLAAHLVYGLVVWSTYEVMRPRSLARIAADVWAWRLAHKVPSFARSPVGRVARMWASVAA